MNELGTPQRAAFIPMLYLNNLSAAIEFYKKAFSASENWRVTNDDGSVHVAELAVGSAIIRMHEEVLRDNVLSPENLKATTVILTLIVDDPDTIFSSAISAGATEISAVKDYEYGYRQGTVRDPSGHHWCLEKRKL